MYSKIKQTKNLLKTLDINELYKIQNYVYNSQEFFSYLEKQLDHLNFSCGVTIDDLIDFYNNIYRSYSDFKIKLGVK